MHLQKPRKHWHNRHYRGLNLFIFICFYYIKEKTGTITATDQPTTTTHQPIQGYAEISLQELATLVKCTADFEYLINYFAD